jgi:hypothetical protein
LAWVDGSIMPNAQRPADDRETGRIPISEFPDTPPIPASFSLDARVLAKVVQCIDRLLCDSRGLPNGNGKRTQLTLTQRHKFKSALIEAVEHANVWASRGPLPNRVRGRGRPPDNAVFIFIDDIVRACEGAGLKPGLRYVNGSESLPVLLFIKFARLLWGPVNNPRRLFERWQRLRADLRRG